MTPLVPWSPRERATVYVDTDTGAGVDDAGRTVRLPARDGRKAPNVPDLLDGARAIGAERVYLTGRRPRSTWLLLRTPGWTAGAHYFDAEAPVGRFTHDATGARLELRRAAEWFGGASYGPADARAARELLATVYARHVPGGRLFDSPAATGMDAWLRSLPRGAEPPAQLTADQAAHVRATSPQHRVELVPAAGELAGFHYLDGRLMYAALTRELGVGPLELLSGAQAAELADRDPYARARFRVRFTVPAGWEHVGAFMVPAEDGDTWETPARPGITGETWCDSAELHVARRHGWRVELLEGYVFGKGRPLDTWTARLLRAAADADTERDAPELVRAMVRAAMRAVLIQAIGAFHSTGRTVTRVVTNPMQYRGAGSLEHRGQVYVARERSQLTGRAAAMLHPEWSAQVWGRAHARILESPTAEPGVMAGAWYCRPGEVLGIRGDALYLARRPRWADDGRVGRLRVKGHLHGPLAAPTTYDQLNQLRERAELLGAECEGCR